MENAIEVKNLTKRYKDFTLDHISFSLPKGMILGLIGENGAGKSTFINSLLGIVKSEYEQIQILGLDLASHEKQIKGDIAAIFDDARYDDLPKLGFSKISELSETVFTSAEEKAENFLQRNENEAGIRGRLKPQPETSYPG